MSLSTQASALVLSAFKNNKKALAFKDDFIGAFFDWIRPAFLKEDPALVEQLEQAPDQEATKQQLNDKMAVLLNNDAFRQQMESWIQQDKQRRKNVVEDATVETKGDIDIGDRTPTEGPDAEQKNIIKGGSFKSEEGGFRLGDG